jgi:hypothetical protein
LNDARLQIHYAAQPIAAVAMTFSKPLPDDSHRNMEWLPDLESIAGHRLPSLGGVRIALRPSDLTLQLLGPSGELLGSEPLAGKTLHQAYCAAGELATSHNEVTYTPLLKPEYELPVHSVGSGQPLRIKSPEPFEEVSRWFADAALLLSEFSTATPGASSVRLWPHHFDIATLVTLDGERSVGVGLSPGDASYREPYWYVSPHPRPEAPAPPELSGGGAWHSEGWFGAVLTGSAVVSDSGAPDQLRRCREFLDSALAASRKLVHA